MPDTILSPFRMLSHLILIGADELRNSIPCLTDEEMGAQRGQVTCPRLHRRWVVESEFRPKQDDLRGRLSIRINCL